MFDIVSEHFDGEVKVIRPKMIFDDKRGRLSVTYLRNEMRNLGLPEFVRDLHSVSNYGVIRGLHYQFNPPMGKLMRVTRGRAFMVAVDMNQLSPYFLRHHAITIHANENLQIWASAGFARGFCALSNDTEVQYKCSEYVGADEAVLWNDPEIGIDWPVKNPILSERDKHARTIREYLEGR